MVAGVIRLCAETALSDPRLRDDFVTASLLMVTPGERVYQAFGHAAIRMECPSEGLDYVFTFESGVGPNLPAEFARGMDARFIAVETPEFIDGFRKEGRGIYSYRLNLSPVQKQELWRVLDERLQSEMLDIDIRRTNCLSSLFAAVQEAAEEEAVDVRGSEIAGMSNGEYFEVLTGENYPWAELLFKSLYGAQSDECDEVLVRTSPVSFMREHDRFRIGDRRLTEDSTVLLKERKTGSAGAVTPVAVCIVLAALLMLSAILRVSGRWRTLRIAMETVALTIIAAAGCLEMFLTLFPWRIGSAWSWSYLVCNPVAPALLLLFRHRRKAYMGTLLAWGSLCMIYALFGRMITSEATDAVRILALAIGIWGLASALVARRRRSC